MIKKSHEFIVIKMMPINRYEFYKIEKKAVI